MLWRIAVSAGFGVVAIAVLSGTVVPTGAQAPAGSAGVTDRNNTPATAFAARAGAVISGTLAAHSGSRDSQFIAITLDDSWKGQRFDLVLRTTPATRSESLDFAYVLADGSDGEIRQGAGEARLTNLSFAPGTPIFRVSAVAATDLPYTVSVEHASALPAGEEHEPNDLPALANDLPPDGTISGGADGAADFDSFRLHVPGPPSLFRVTCDCPQADRLTILGGDGNAIVQTAEFPGGKAELSGVLLAGGDHIIRVRNNGGRYALHVVPTRPAPREVGGAPPPVDAPIAAVDEIEPNGDVATAMPLALDSSRGGVTDFANDVDVYRFTLFGPTPVHLTLENASGPRQEFSLGRGADNRQIARLALEAGARTPLVWDGTLPGGDYYIQIWGPITSVPYRLRLSAGDPFAAGASSQALPVTAALTLDTPNVAAYAPDAQTVSGHIDLTSKATAAMDLSLATYAADERWTISAGRTTVHVDAGGRASVPITIRVAPQAWANHPVQIAVGVRDGSGAHVTAKAVVMPDVTTVVVSPSPAPAIPSALAGGLNVAWSALGAASLDNHPTLIDGLINAGGTLTAPLADVKDGVAIRLAGQGVRLVGLILVPAGSVPVSDRLHRFNVLASRDGTTFTPLLSGTLPPRDDPQAFVLPTPTDAQVLKLVPVDAQDPTSTTVSLAELEAIADPSTAPLGATGLEISPILRGGHVVTMEPYVDTQAMFTDTAQFSSSSSWPGTRTEPFSWVVAFLDDRAARIDRVDWRYSPTESAYGAIPSVDVFGSMATPNGPWTKLGTWTIAPTGDSTPFRPAGQPLVRYLRFVAARTKAGYTADLPLHLSIHEMPIGASYHSVLGVPDAPASTAVASAAAPKSGGVAPLPFDTPVHGAVRAGVAGDQWTLTVPAGAGGVTLTLANVPAVGAALTVKNAGGAIVPLKEDDASPDVHRYTVALGPGQYAVTVVEPPHSIAVVWDTSSSVGGWTPAIIAAVRSFVQDAVPGRDEISLLPLHDPVAKPLLPAYTGDPAQLFSLLQAYAWQDASSGAEGGLVGAMQTFENRPGRHAIVLLTDAETSSLPLTPQVWALAAKTTPQIFTLSVSTRSVGDGAWRSRTLMVDWAVATGGANTLIGDVSGTDAAFARAAAALRGWMPYTLTASISATPPAPGSLTVTRAAPPTAAAAPAPRPAVALLLDASGSMLQAIKGRRKIDIARAELDHLVRSVLPDATPVTLRVYGQGGPGSCNSDLMMPLAPLDRAKAEAIVATVRSTNGAKTATAASLHATTADLAGAPGAKRVILITDGEENCGGDVEAEIAALRKSGVDVELDVVGFAIDSAASGRTFEQWAGLGGGRYYEAKDAATLDTAVRAAVTEHFDVVDAAGAVVASGDVGGKAVSLAAGHYNVRLHGNAAVSSDVDVPPGGSASAVLP